MMHLEHSHIRDHSRFYEKLSQHYPDFLMKNVIFSPTYGLSNNLLRFVMHNKCISDVSTVPLKHITVELNQSHS